MADDSKRFIPPDKQRRQSARLKTQSQGLFKMKNSTSWEQCTILDVGIGGLYIQGSHSFYVGDKVDVKFSLQDKFLTLEIVITNVQGKKAGGSFANVPENTVNYIREVLHSAYFDSTK